MQITQFMQIIVNATFLINTLRIKSEILQVVKLSTIQSVALEIQNELGVEIDNYKVEILQKESDSIDLSNDKKQRLSSTDVSLLNH